MNALPRPGLLLLQSHWPDRKVPTFTRTHVGESRVIIGRETGVNVCNIELKAVVKVICMRKRFKAYGGVGNIQSQSLTHFAHLISRPTQLLTRNRTISHNHPIITQKSKPNRTICYITYPNMPTPPPPLQALVSPPSTFHPPTSSPQNISLNVSY